MKEKKGQPIPVLPLPESSQRISEKDENEDEDDDVDEQR
tara:strand:+ start:708 stop:824 length:117 start_codon:yes stop_codon:yes gene_type:complete